MNIKEDTKLNAGSCTFCDRTNYRKVYVLKSGSGSAIVRVCKNCMKKIKSKV